MLDWVSEQALPVALLEARSHLRQVQSPRAKSAHNVATHDPHMPEQTITVSSKIIANDSIATYRDGLDSLPTEGCVVLNQKPHNTTHIGGIQKGVEVCHIRSDLPLCRPRWSFTNRLVGHRKVLFQDPCEEVLRGIIYDCASDDIPDVRNRDVILACDLFPREIDDVRPLGQFGLLVCCCIPTTSVVVFWSLFVPHHSLWTFVVGGTDNALLWIERVGVNGIGWLISDSGQQTISTFEGRYETYGVFGIRIVILRGGFSFVIPQIAISC